MTDRSHSEAAVLFSGGSDSTLTAALVAERHDHVHLLTFKRFGIFSVKHAGINAGRLMERYGADRFTHRTIAIDRLFKKVSYDRYWRSLRRHGLFVLSTCGLCKLAMHLRALLYCLEQRIPTVCDGANQAMNIYPAQMRPVIDELREMYAHFGISYETPVFEYDGPSEMTFFPEGSGRRTGNGPDAEGERTMTTDRRLFEMGLLDSPSIKGTPADHAMQARCFQFVLFRVFVHSYYLPAHSYEEYVEATVRFHKERIARFEELVRQHLDHPRYSPLLPYL